MSTNWAVGFRHRHCVTVPGRFAMIHHTHNQGLVVVVRDTCERRQYLLLGHTVHNHRHPVGGSVEIRPQQSYGVASHVIRARETINRQSLVSCTAEIDVQVFDGRRWVVVAKQAEENVEGRVASGCRAFVDAE